MFRALMVDRSGSGVTAEVRSLELDQLPPGDVLVSVEYSSLNYKDGLAVTGRGKIIRGELPFVPGIDLAGVVEESASSDFSPGDRVAVTGWGIGEKHWGGYAQRARVRPEWIVPLPASLSTHDAMVVGTAGLTAMIAVMELEAHGVEPGGKEVVVTGASGGVGSMAVALLAKRGFSVVASTGGADAHPLLVSLGASDIIDRYELPSAAGRSLDTARWAGAIDTVGGATLAGILAQLELHGSVAACGNAGGHELQTTVFPFILRGINLLGIDSNTAPAVLRREAWDRLAAELTPEDFRTIESGLCRLEEIPGYAAEITEGKINGRVVVDVNG
jgi:acrylyl-CoA reductase (NADPH)